MRRRRSILLVLLILVIYALHQDFWNWEKVEPLVLGFLPVGLAYHVGYSMLATGLMAILVKFAWPRHLEQLPEDEDSSHKGAQK